MCVYVRVCVRRCVLCSIYGLSKNFECYEDAIPGAVGVACGAIFDDNADASQRYF